MTSEQKSLIISQISLIAKGEIQAFRTGENGRGRILVPKSSLLAYFDRL